eukprot:3759868-Prymnesium_polylepis.1
MQKSASMAATFWWRPVALVDGSAHREAVGASRIACRTARSCILCTAAWRLARCNPIAQLATRHSAFETGGFPVGWRVGWPPAERRIRPR